MEAWAMFIRYAFPASFIPRSFLSLGFPRVVCMIRCIVDDASVRLRRLLAIPAIYLDLEGC